MTNLAKAGGAFVLLGIVAGCRPAPVPAALDPATRAAIADTVRTVSDAMIVAMRARQIDSVLAYYGKETAYVGNGEIGDWTAIVRGAPPRYATYTKVE